MNSGGTLKEVHHETTGREVAAEVSLRSAIISFNRRDGFFFMYNVT
jgi:hypothetical protein